MRILITGGLGFLGSNLATKLSFENHDIIILDNLDPLYGGSRFNLSDANNQIIEVVIGDVTDTELVSKLVRGIDIVFHFAAQVSYIDSLNMPMKDIAINATATMILLEAIRELKQDTKIVFASSRMVYGKTISTPIREDHPTVPLSLYGTHKLTSERYLEIYHKNFGIKYNILRITNPYGIKQQMKHNKYGLVGWFIRQAMENKTIKIFGEGTQRRDYLFAEDIVNAFCSVAFCSDAANNIYTLGSGQSVQFREMVECVVNTVGNGNIEFVEWPKDYEKLETGDCELSIEKLQNDTGWRPNISLEEGVRKTHEFYKLHLDKYFGYKCGYVVV